MYECPAKPADARNLPEEKIAVEVSLIIEKDIGSSLSGRRIDGGVRIRVDGYKFDGQGGTKGNVISRKVAETTIASVIFTRRNYRHLNTVDE